MDTCMLIAHAVKSVSDSLLGNHILSGSARVK